MSVVLDLKRSKSEFIAENMCLYQQLIVLGGWVERSQLAQRIDTSCVE